MNETGICIIYSFTHRAPVRYWRMESKLGLLTGICFAATAVHISFRYEKWPFGL
jgi:hypothetical protein